MFFLQSFLFFPLLRSITGSHDQPWVCIVNSDLCTLSLGVRGRSAVTNNAVIPGMNCFLPVMQAFFFIYIYIKPHIYMYFNTLLYYNSCLPNPSAICFESLINLLDGILFTKAFRDLLNGFALGRNVSSWELGSIKVGILGINSLPMLWKKVVASFDKWGSWRNKIRRRINRRIISVNSPVFHIRADSALMCIAVSPEQLRNIPVVNKSFPSAVDSMHKRLTVKKTWNTV